MTLGGPVPSITHARLLVRASAAGVAAFALTGAVAIVPPAASALTTQPVTVVTSVDGVPGGSARPGAVTTATFAVTNGSTTGASLGAFSIVVPRGVTSVRAGTVSGPGAWRETVLPCGRTASCSAIVLVSATLPLNRSLLRPGATVAASLTFTAPTAPGSYRFPFLGIGGGLFTVAGPTPSITVADDVAVALRVTVPSPVSAGTATDVTVTSRNAGGQAVPFAGGPVTVGLGAQDAGATVMGDAFAGAPTVVVDVPASSSGVFTLSTRFTLATASQTVQVTTGSIQGTSDAFAVDGGAPAALQITAVGDTSSDPALPTPAAGQSFAVGFTVLDQFGNRATHPDVLVTLVATDPAGGGVLTAPAVTSSGGTGTVSATYSVAQLGLQLEVGSAGLTSGTASTDVVSAGASTLLTPGTPATLTAGTASAGLPNGGFGATFLTTAPCTAPQCHQGTEISLSGTFTDPDGGGELYSDAHPASVAWTCGAADCPHRDAAGESWRTDYQHNLFSRYAGAEREVYEDFVDYPIEVSLLVGGEYQPFAKAPSCVDMFDPSKIGRTGVLDSVAAKAAGFCVDVYAITRSATASSGQCQSYFGDLTLPVLFVEDPKMRA